MAALSKSWVCCRFLAGMAGLNPDKGMDFCLSSVVCCPVDVSATDRSLVQRSPTDCGASEWYRETSQRWPRPYEGGGCRAMGKNTNFIKTKKFSENLNFPCAAGRENLRFFYMWWWPLYNYRRCGGTCSLPFRMGDCLNESVHIPWKHKYMVGI
jgi:hypothetical protein